jgi:hypothetical protein
MRQPYRCAVPSPPSQPPPQSSDEKRAMKIALLVAWGGSLVRCGVWLLGSHVLDGESVLAAVLVVALAPRLARLSR